MNREKCKIMSVKVSQFNSCHRLQFAPLAFCHCTVQETLQGRSDSDRRSSPAVSSPLHGQTRIRLILICKYPLCWRYNTLPPLNEKSPGAASVPWRRRKHWKIQITLATPPSLSLPLFSICPPPSLHMPRCPPRWAPPFLPHHLRLTFLLSLLPLVCSFPYRLVSLLHVLNSAFTCFYLFYSSLPQRFFFYSVATN